MAFESFLNRTNLFLTNLAFNSSDLDILSSELNLLPDFGLLFLDNTQDKTLSLGFNTGLVLQRSSNFLTRLDGKKKMQENKANNIPEIETKEKGLGLLKTANAFNVIGGISDFVGSFLPNNKSEYNGPKGHITLTIDNFSDTIASAASKFGPVGLIVSGSIKGLDTLSKVGNSLGGGTDAMTTTDAIFGSSLLAPIGLINGFAGKRAETITKDTELFETVGSSYTGSNFAVDMALEKSGKKYGLFSSSARHKANEEIRDAIRQQSIITDISNQATDRFALRNSMAAINGNRRASNLEGRYNLAAVRVGRQGMVIAKKIVSQYKIDKKKEQYITPQKNSFISEINFKDGGILSKNSFIIEIELDPIEQFREGGTFNIIPDGALHARLHNMENADNLTKKGIPVVSEKEGGELELLAEIEKEEIILRLSLTKRLEELAKEGTDDAAIEAGKILVEEILNNTIDNTNILL